MTLRRGDRVVERYLVDARLGAGGMGEVFRALDEQTRAPVAIKVLYAVDDPVMLRRFLREAELMARTCHAHVVRIIEIVAVPGAAMAIVMELVEGGTLADLVDREGGSLPWPRAVAATRAMLAGLSAIHAANIVHRDLKPANILLPQGREDLGKVADFGIAKPVENVGTKLTATGHVVGTADYVSPEQLRGETVDARSDLYTVGLILYELVSGSSASPAASKDAHPLAGAIRRITDGLPPLRAARHRPPVPAELRVAVARCLEARADARFPSAAALDARLAAVPLVGQASTGLALAMTEPAARLGWEPPVSARTATAPHPAAAAARVVLVVVAALPRAAATRAADRQWLGTLLGASGRGFVRGGRVWIGVRDADRGAVDTLVARLRDALRERFGDIPLRTSIEEERPAISPAMLAGAAPLPPALALLVDELDGQG